MAQQVQYTATPRRPQWQDLSDEHTRVRASLEAALRDFAEGKGARVKSIVGAYGSGKSELMAWGFHQCWTALGVPALILNAEQLLARLPQKMGPGDLADEIGRFALDQLARLLATLEESPHPAGVLLATDIRQEESVAGYLLDLFDGRNGSVDHLCKLLQKQRAVIFLDEIEQKYSDLLERVESSDRAPLRELLQRVEQGLTPYYLVLSFGLTSAYEAIGGADARRMDTLTLPIPNPRELGRLAGLAGYENFIWWTSRGRPGWAVKLANDWAGSLDAITGLEEFSRLQPNTIENLPLVNANGFPQALSIARVNELATQLLKRLEPVQRSSLSLSQPEAQTSTNLPHHQVLVVNQESDLVGVDVLVDAFVQDLMEQATKLNISNVDTARLRLYLTTVMESLADAERRVAFGGPRKTEWLAKGALAPILTLVVDLLLEFEGDHQDAMSVLNLLDKVMGDTGIVGEEVQDAYKLVERFQRVEEIFIEIRPPLPETAWISLSPRAVEEIFPRIVGRPLLTLTPKAKRTLDEQRAAVEAAVAAGAPLLTSIHHHDKSEAKFIFAPDEQCWSRVRSAQFGRERRHTYLKEAKIYVLVPLTDNGAVELVDFGAPDDAAILRDLGKLQRGELREKRLEDFMISLWHHALLHHSGNGGDLDLWEVLEAALQSEGLSKSNRRKLEHYRQRLGQRLDDLVAVAVPEYRRNLRKLFNVEDDRFPAKRLEETRAKVRENRTIEQVALAFDLAERAESATAVLGDLRELKLLRKATAQPHAYDEFLETYTVVTRPTPGPGISLKELVDYAALNGFESLRELAGRLSLDPPPGFEEAQQATENAPLLTLFQNVAPTQASYLRGVSLHRYLESNQDVYIVLAGDLRADVQQLVNRLDTLAARIEALNRDVDYPLLSRDIVVNYVNELRELDELLAKAPDLPPATLYVLYRFTESAAAKVEELQQRWASEHGLEGWRSQLASLAGWQRKVEGIGEELAELFAQHGALKNEILGPRKALENQLCQQIQNAAQAVLESVDQESDLRLGVRRLPVADYDKAADAVRERLNKLADEATLVDQVARRLETLAIQTQALIDRFSKEEQHDAA